MPHLLCIGVAALALVLVCTVAIVALARGAPFDLRISCWGVECRLTLGGGERPQG